MKFDFGQIELACAIFKDNKQLLDKVDQGLVDLFRDLILNEGRQAPVLQFFIEIQQCRNVHRKLDFITENQLFVINLFLHMSDISEERVPYIKAVVSVVIVFLVAAAVLGPQASQGRQEVYKLI